MRQPFLIAPPDPAVQMLHLRGILSMLAAVATFSMMDVTMKHLVATYPPMQVTFMRGLASLPLLIGAAGLFGQWQDLMPRRWRLHLVRGLLSVVTLWGFVYAVKRLSLADAYTIFMSAPLLITALSMPLLGERVGPRRWAAVIVGLCGVVVVLKPSGTSLITLGGLAALGAALGYAFSALTIRILSRTDTGSATVVWALAVMSLISGVLAIDSWVAIDWGQWPWLIGLGVTGALGQYFITEAFRRAPPAVIAPLEYTALAWGILFDWFIWMTAPSSRMLLGATIIVASGIYVIHRERNVITVSATPGDLGQSEACERNKP
jgi:drug/metabolite transporter (DMT)-like permease